MLVQSLPMSRADLNRVREWATSKLSACQEPLSADHPYIKVVHSVDTFLDGMNFSVAPRERSLRTLRPSTLSNNSRYAPRPQRNVSI